MYNRKVYRKSREFAIERQCTALEKVGKEMNDRIKELIDMDDRMKDYCAVGPVQRASVEDLVIRILQECCKVIDNHYEPVYDGRLLMEHFGVE
jgi:hypothetical protein